MAATGFLEVRAFSTEPQSATARIYPVPRVITPGLSFKDRFATWIDKADVALGAVDALTLPFPGGYSVRVLDQADHREFKHPVRIGDKSADVTRYGVVHVLNAAEEVVARIPARALAEAPHRLDTVLLRRTR